MTLELVGAERAWGMQGPRVAEKTGLFLPQSAGTPRALLGDPREGGRGLAHPWGPMSRVGMVARIPNRRHSFCASLFYSLKIVFMFADYKRSSSSL